MGGGGSVFDPNAIHGNRDHEIDVVAEKLLPVNADLVIIEDSAAGYIKKKAQLVNLPVANGADGTAIHDDTAGEISAVAEKALPVAADLLLIEDSAAGNAKKKVQVGNLPAGGGGGNCSMKTGTYVGDGADPHAIDIGVNLAAKTHVYLVIKAAATKLAQHRIEYGQGDLTMLYGATADAADKIQGLTATGFELGGHADVNAAATTFRYIAFWVD
jgi:hypothetical protein